MTAFFPPIGIFLWGLAGGFAIPLLYRLGKPWLHGGFFTALIGLTLCSIAPLATVIATGMPLEIETAGAAPPIAINLRMGLEEGVIAVAVNLTAILLAVALWDRLRGAYAPLLLFLLLVMGVNGMILTRDLFNLFVFLEIVSVGTYGLLTLSDGRAGVEAAFKYVIATVVASTLFLLGAALLYLATGRLNIDLLLADAGGLTGPIAGAGAVMVLACLLLELKPWPANGWALDVYQTAPAPLAAFLSVCGSAGMAFALWKLLPLFAPWHDIVIVAAAATFVLSNLTGLRQRDVQRMLGYSSIAQMALLTLAVAALQHLGVEATPLIAFGLFINHMLAKAGLFCCAAALGARRVSAGVAAPSRGLLVLLTLFVVAIIGLPPFPGFWAKWAMLTELAAADQLALVAAILIGSLLEAAYLVRWLTRCFRTAAAASAIEQGAGAPLRLVAPTAAFAAMLTAAGVAGAQLSGALSGPALWPVVAAAALTALEALPARARGLAMLATVAAVSLAMPPADALAALFATLLLAGGLAIAAALLRHRSAPVGLYPLTALLLLSVQTLARATTGLEFYVAWEFIAVASLLLIGFARGPEATLRRYAAFSLISAYLLLAGFAILAAQGGSGDLATLRAAGPDATLAVALMGAGLLIKAAAVGAHVWLPGAYADAPGEITALLSAVVSKAAIFGLLLGGYALLRGAAAIDFGPTLAWIGMATTVAGAWLALAQTDPKRLLAFSSMSQLGYVVTAIGLMSHLGWVTALYIVASHMLVKGVLFLALAGVALRGSAGGLLRAMPVTALFAAVALLSMSGLPPLTGFGAKWLLLSAITEKGWLELAALGAVATALGLAYMARFFAMVFLGLRPADAPAVREAPVMLLAPQAVLLAGVIVLSLFPKLLMDPVSAAIDPQFASTLVWRGESLETIYGLWDPTPTMLSSLAIAAALGVAVWLIAWLGPARSWLAPLPVWAAPPVAERGWVGAASGAQWLAQRARAIYSGDGQTYLLMVVGYFLALYYAAVTLGD